ncbi:MAG: hypothetical protein F2927_05465, partial [Actinobacteria bacterium]|nr:hypothetical protein [Actinomycetota bacterium]
MARACKRSNCFCVIARKGTIEGTSNAMISSLFGRVLHLSADRAVVDISGVGFSVLITPVTSSRLSVGNDAQLFTSLVVR